MWFRHLMSLLALLSAAAAHAQDAQPKRMEWQIDGTTREALVFAPSLRGEAAAPVVFAFHGHGGNMASASRKSSYQTLWPEALVVYMQGLPTPGKFDPEGERPGWQKSAGDQGDRDLKFFDEVLATVRKDYAIDEKRIYVTGHSNGGGFTYLLWAARGDVFAAVAPSAGGAGGNLKAPKPLPALHVAGEHDERVPFSSQKRTMEIVRSLNGCSAEGTPWANSGTLVGTLYPSASGTPFVSVIYPGGHQYPSEASALIVKFFKEHAKSS
jgi:polyhydroxybutyrate depolymerase